MPGVKVMLAPDSFKGSLTAEAAAGAMAAGMVRLGFGVEVDRCPIADGGEGFVAAMAAATTGRLKTTRVAGPLGDEVEAAWLMLADGTAVIETAAASGLTLVAEGERDALRASTFGTGQLVAAALDAGCRAVLLGLGGSATTDGGAGMAQALGFRFLDGDGRELVEAIGGGMLSGVADLDPGKAHRRLRDVAVTAACDVTNPLIGPEGAAAVYGPQKGATPGNVTTLDGGLRRLAVLWRLRLGVDVERTPGAGAAGGLGGGAVAFLGAALRPGIEIVLDAVGFEGRVAGCDLCLTGEGRLDGQSRSGKAVTGVARAAQRHGVPTVALVGSVADDAAGALGDVLAGVRVIGEGLTAPESMARAAALLADHAEAAVRERLSEGR
ncbi:MAG: glycerate kinase [Planctomycetota bacterium]